VADRGFCSYAHLALLVQAGVHAVFRIHQKHIVDFTPGRPHVEPRTQRDVYEATTRPQRSGDPRDGASFHNRPFREAGRR
jgi:hypothetical protein